MRATRIFTVLATLALLGTTAEAQQARLVGTKRAEVRVNAGYAMPEILLLTRKAEPTRSIRGNGFAEYQLAYTVAANMQWTLEATALPAGVTLRTDDGAWAAEAGTSLFRGDATNPTTVTVTVRVATDAPASWAQDLALELRAQR